MAEISEDTSIEELAVIISEALEAAGITATLSGGGAVSIYSHNQYMRADCAWIFARDHANPLRDRPISCLPVWIRSAMLGSGSHGLPKPFD